MVFLRHRKTPKDTPGISLSPMCTYYAMRASNEYYMYAEKNLLASSVVSLQPDSLPNRELGHRSAPAFDF